MPFPRGLNCGLDPWQGPSGGVFRAQNPHFSPTRFHEDPIAGWCARRVESSDPAAVEQAMRAYAQEVARDITQEGPAAWRRHFAHSPAVFMASEGTLGVSGQRFRDSGNSGTGTDHEVLKWGDDL